MFSNNRFTQKAEGAIKLASDIAHSMGHGYVGTEHLLLGLLKLKNSTASKVLLSNNITEEKIISKIDELIGIQRGLLVNSSGFTPRTKKVLDNALAEANSMSSEYVGTEHLLLSLLNEVDSVAMKILGSNNIDPNKLTNDIFNEISDSNPRDYRPYSSYSSKSNKKKVPTPTLDQYSQDLIQSVRNGKVDPVIGRGVEIERLIQILSRRTKNNPCLIGEPGVR